MLINTHETDTARRTLTSRRARPRRRRQLNAAARRRMTATTTRSLRPRRPRKAVKRPPPPPLRMPSRRPRPSWSRLRRQPGASVQPRRLLPRMKAKTSLSRKLRHPSPRLGANAPPRKQHLRRTRARRSQKRRRPRPRLKASAGPKRQRLPRKTVMRSQSWRRSPRPKASAGSRKPPRPKMKATRSRSLLRRRQPKARKLAAPRPRKRAMQSLRPSQRPSPSLRCRRPSPREGEDVAPGVLLEARMVGHVLTRRDKRKCSTTILCFLELCSTPALVPFLSSLSSRQSPCLAVLLVSGT